MRQRGKNWPQVILSAKTTTPIICASKEYAEQLKALAAKLGVEILETKVLEARDESYS